MADQKQFNGHVNFKNIVQIENAGNAECGPTGILYGRKVSEKIDPFTEGTTALYPLGTPLVHGSREYRYCRVGSGGIAKGLLVQTAAILTNTRDLSPTDATTAAGSKTLSVELGGSAAAVAANQFQDGFVVINDGAGEGHIYQVRSNTAVADASVDPTIVFTFYEPLQVAVTTGGSSKIDIIPNPYYNVETADHDSGNFTGAVVGATAMGLTANNFGWIQTKGPAPLLTVSTVDMGDQVVRARGTSNGGVQASADDTDAKVGVVLHQNDGGDYSVILLDI